MKTELETLCTIRGIKIDCKFIGEAVWPDMGEHVMRKWRVTLRRNFKKHGGRTQLTTTFYQGIAHTKEPTAADVLYCLIRDVVPHDQSFEEWASDLGYETDSRKAERIFKACLRTGPRVRRFLSTHLETFAQAEH